MNGLEIQEILMLAVILSVPVSILVGAVVYVVRMARKGPEATLAAASRRRELR